MASKIIKSTSIVSAMTLLSRISGLIRDIVFANLLGDKAAADVFFVAFRIPNFFRRIFAEGAFSAAFVPVFSEYRHHKELQQSRNFVALLLGRFALILLLFSALGVVFAPYLVAVLAPGFDGGQAQLTVQATRFTFPYLFFVSLVAMSAAMLNTCDRFAAPAATPVLLNISLIVSAFVLVPMVGHDAIGLAIGVLIAGFVQLLFQWPFLKREQLLVMPRLTSVSKKTQSEDRSDIEGVTQVFKLILPAIFAVSAAQIAVMISTILASFLETGSVAWLYYSDRLMEFPVGVFGIALATVVLPNLSKKFQSGDHNLFSQTLDWAMRWVCLICLPAAVALIVLAEPIVTTIYYHGDFTERGVLMTANSLIAYALGLLPLVMVKILATGFFARKNTKTPVKIATVATIVGIVFSLVLIWPLKHVGLALAVSLSASLNALGLFWFLRKQGILELRRGWWVFLWKIVGASIVMAIVVWWLSADQLWLDKTMIRRIIDMTLLVFSGLTAYLLALLVLRINFRHFIVAPSE